MHQRRATATTAASTSASTSTSTFTSTKKYPLPSSSSSATETSPSLLLSQAPQHPSIEEPPKWRKRQRRRPHSSSSSSSPFKQSSVSMLVSTISNFIFGKDDDDDDGLTCLIGLVVLVAVLIGLALILLFQLLDSQPNKAKPSYNHNNNVNNDDDDEQFPELPASPIYTVPHSMSYLGDRSDAYAQLRKDMDQIYPYDPQRSLQTNTAVRKYYNLTTFLDPSKTATTTTTTTTTTKQTDLDHGPAYDIYNCPEEPPEGYPYEWSTVQLLRHWNPDTTQVPSQIHQGICVFDFRTDHVKALTYRAREVPFVVRSDPEVAAVVERWNHPNYLDNLMAMDNTPHRAEVSETNHFMYWMPGDAKRRKQRKGSFGRELENTHQKKTPPQPLDWQAPTRMIRMTYAEWIQRANRTLDELRERDPTQLGVNYIYIHPALLPNQPHWYFRLIGCGETGPKGTCDQGSSEWLFDELTFFQPKPGQLYLTDPNEQRGIHCRFGMTGVTIANHFDQSRNAIALLGGTRRYILSHPKHCSNLALFPTGHPSARHSSIDWSKPEESLQDFPDFSEAKSNEVVLEAGDVLYLPTNWFHYIVSLELNFQCNTRSGISEDYMEPIQQCGF